MIPAHAPHGGAAVATGSRDFGPGARTEQSAGTGGRQDKTHRGPVDRTPRFVSDEYTQAASGPRAGSIDRVVALGDANGESRRVAGRESQGSRQEGHKGLGYRPKEHMDKWAAEPNTLR